MWTKTLSIVTAGMLLLCLCHMPYGYYVLVRFVAAVAFCVVAYALFESGRKELCVVCIVAALLFQPFVKVHLGRVMWNIVDVLAALFLLAMLYFHGRAGDGPKNN